MAYTRVNWQDSPSTATPISASNLNKMDKGIKDLEGDLGTLSSSLATVATSGSYNDLTNKPQNHLVNVSNEVDDTYRVNLLETKNLFTITSVLPNTALNNNVVFSSSEWDIFVIPVEIGTTYTISKTSYNGGILSFNTTFPKIDDTVNNAQTLRNISTLTFEAKDNYLCLMIAKSDDKTTIQVEKGSTATTYSPFMQNQIVVDNEKYSDTLNVGTSVDSRSRVNVLKGNNLVKNILETQTKNGVTFTKNDNGSITLSGTATTNFTVLINTINLKAGKTYTISGGSSISANVRLDMRTSLDGALYENDWYLPNTATKTIRSNITLYFSLRVASGTNTSGITIYPMLNEGSTVLPYEPYITPSIYVDNEEIYQKREWKYLGKTTGNSATINTPSDAKEIFALVEQNNSLYLRFPIIFPTACLTSSMMFFNTGYYRVVSGSAYGSYVRIGASTSTLRLEESDRNGASETSITNVYWYYK